MSAAIALDRRLDRPMNTLVLRSAPPIREVEDAAPTPARDDAAPFVRKMESAAAFVMPPAAPSVMPSASETCVMMMLPVEAIRLTPEQTRRCLDDAGVDRLESIDSLAAAISENGPLQAVLVRPIEGGYALITGEHHLCAATLARLKKIPAIVKTVSADRALELSLLEDLRRARLRPLEKARAFHTLCDKNPRDQKKTSHTELARQLGINPRTVSNTIRLLKLGKDVLALIESGRLRAGHGKALLGIRDKARQLELATRAMGEKWSVHRLEKKVRAETGRTNRSPVMGQVVKALLESALNIETTTRRKRGGGELLEIEFREPRATHGFAALLGVTT